MELVAPCNAMLEGPTAEDGSGGSADAIMFTKQVQKEQYRFKQASRQTANRRMEREMRSTDALSESLFCETKLKLCS